MESIQSDVATSQNGEPKPLIAEKIGGLTASQTYEPASAEELAELLAVAHRENQAVTPRGGGTHMGIGNIPARLDWVISTAGLNKVIAYEPPDMTLSIESGATLGDVQRVLAENGQTLPIEVSNPERATIGGTIASALYGPRRLGSGTLRDYLIGITVAYPGGSLGKAGGMVVKNVSGFDLMRMHHGALGTLGIVVSANFKVLPKPRSERTVFVELDSIQNIDAIKFKVLAGGSGPAAFEVLIVEGKVTAFVRIEGRERTTGLLTEELASTLGKDAGILEPDASREFWGDYVAGFESGDSPQSWWLRSRVRPSETGHTLEAFGPLLAQLESRNPMLSCSPGLGYLDLLCQYQVTDDRDLKTLVERMRTFAPKTTIVTAPYPCKRDVDVWGDAIDSLDLMRMLKLEFDPNAILNPGRFVGRL